MKNKKYHTRKSGKKYHTVGKVRKNTTLSEKYEKIPHCRKNAKKYHTVGKVRNSSIHIVERDKINIPNAQIHQRFPGLVHSLQ
jgi:hypothetical protein